MGEIECGTNGRLRSGGGLKESSLSTYRLHFPSLADRASFVGGMVGKRKIGWRVWLVYKPGVDPRADLRKISRKEVSTRVKIDILVCGCQFS